MADAEQARQQLLPFSKFTPLLYGVLAGIALRIVFSGAPGKAYATMLGAFIYLSPLIVGAVTVYMAERVERRSWGYYAAAPFLANVFYVLGTLAIMIEGLICAIVIVPLFALLGAVGGLIMGVVCRLTNWPKPTLYTLWALPLLLGAVEHQLPLPQRKQTVETVAFIKASPARVWKEIHNARAIQPHEMERAFFFRIGVPLPHAGVSETDAHKRVITMGKQVRFEQHVTAWEENRHVRWRHDYANDSFPKYALDEHVLLGGHYFDITSTAYTLTPWADGTEIRVQMDYRVSTPFNWYADPVSAFMLRNFEQVLLNFYRERAERT